MGQVWMKCIASSGMEAAKTQILLGMFTMQQLSNKNLVQLKRRKVFLGTNNQSNKENPRTSVILLQQTKCGIF